MRDNGKEVILTELEYKRLQKQISEMFSSTLTMEEVKNRKPFPWTGGRDVYVEKI